MAVISPRGGASLAQVVQAALNVAGSAGVSIVTGGSGNGVQVPGQYVAAVEEALGWTAAERTHPPDPPPTHPATQDSREPDPPHPPPSAVPQPDPPAPAPAADRAQPEPPARKTPGPVKKTTSSSRRAARRKEG